MGTSKLTKRIGLLAAFSLAVGVAMTTAAAAAHCADGEFELGGVVTDAATGAPLTEITSIGITQLDGPYADGAGTDASSSWSQCVPQGTYSVSFFADSYYIEWWNDAYSADEANTIVVDGDRNDINVALDRLTVIVGTVVSGRTGEPLSGSIHIESVDGAYADGQGSDASGNFRLTLSPNQRFAPESYLVAFQMDGHWAEWYDDARKKSRATVIVTERGVAEIDLGTIELRRCSRPEICISGSYNR